MKRFLVVLCSSLMVVLAQPVPLTGTLAYIKNESVMLENLASQQTRTVGNSSVVRWFGFSGSRLIIWRETGLFMALPPYQTAMPLKVSAEFLEGLAFAGERLFLAYRRPNSTVLSYQTFVFASGLMQPSAFFPETSNSDGRVLAYRIGHRLLVLRGNTAETAFEYPNEASLNWGVSMSGLTPDGNSIVFAHNNGSGFLASGYSNWQLILRNLETKQNRILLNRTARIPDGIFVAPDGARALISYAENKKNTLEIVNLQLGVARVIHQNFVEGVAGSWSPNGQYVLAENIAGNNSEVFIKDLGGQTVRTVFGAQLAQWLP
jgi:dipeptidyl aminopeptidase/acylaminoacyl peptidase